MSMHMYILHVCVYVHLKTSLTTENLIIRFKIIVDVKVILRTCKILSSRIHRIKLQLRTSYLHFKISFSQNHTLTNLQCLLCSDEDVYFIKYVNLKHHPISILYIFQVNFNVQVRNWDFILTSTGYGVDSHRAASPFHVPQFSVPKILLLKCHNHNDYCEIKCSVSCVSFMSRGLR